MDKIRIWDGRHSDPGSGINIADPQHCLATSHFGDQSCFNSLVANDTRNEEGLLTQDGCNEDAERDSVGEVGDTRQPGLDSSTVHRCCPPQVWRQGEDKLFLPGFILALIPVLRIWILWIFNLLASWIRIY
jgi:hypothetical protein